MLISKPTQREKVLNFIKKYGYITSLEAYKIGITQLGARIFELKKMGYEFKKERVNTINCLGEKTHYDKYSLKGE